MTSYGHLYTPHKQCINTCTRTDINGAGDRRPPGDAGAVTRRGECGGVSDGDARGDDDDSGIDVVVAVVVCVAVVTCGNVGADVELSSLTASTRVDVSTRADVVDVIADVI